jgi:DNA-binding transcriptional MerR regulator
VIQGAGTHPQALRNEENQSVLTNTQKIKTKNNNKLYSQESIVRALHIKQTAAWTCAIPNKYMTSYM